MPKGLRFFATDFNNLAFGGDISASSREENAHFVFDGLVGTKWYSENQNTNGNTAILTRDYGFNRTVNAFFIYDTNIEDPVIEYWNGSSWIEVEDGVNAEIIKSEDEDFVFAKLDADVTTEQVRLSGDNTFVPNSEKYVAQFLAFSEIGQFNLFPDFDPLYLPEQNVFKTTDGRSFVIERGEAFSATIGIKSMVNSADIELAMTLFDRKEPFYIWPNGGNDNIFRFKFKPFRFQDIIKVTIVGKYGPSFTKNYYRAGLNTNMNIVEVV